MKIASALKSELKDRNSRAKLVAGWTGANERTVKNWILGRYAPCGRHLVLLAQHSDQVLNAILSMADRQDLLLAPKVEDLRRKVFELAAIIGRPDPDAYTPHQRAQKFRPRIQGDGFKDKRVFVSSSARTLRAASASSISTLTNLTGVLG